MYAAIVLKRYSCCSNGRICYAFKLIKTPLIINGILLECMRRILIAMHTARNCLDKVDFVPILARTCLLRMKRKSIYDHSPQSFQRVPRRSIRSVFVHCHRSSFQNCKQIEKQLVVGEIFKQVLKFSRFVI